MVLKNLGRALECGANVGSAFPSRSPKVALSSLPEVKIFNHTGKSFYWTNLYRFYYTKGTKDSKKNYPSLALESKYIDLEQRLEKKYLMLKASIAISTTTKR